MVVHSESKSISSDSLRWSGSEGVNDQNQAGPQNYKYITAPL
jgi:hypothetical protein